jgi:hypothetical protein
VPPGTTSLASYGANGDVLVFSEGDQTVSAGLDKSGLAEGFAGIEFGSGWRGVISAASPLLCDVDNGAGAYVSILSSAALICITPKGDDNLIHRLRLLGSATCQLVGAQGTVTRAEVAAGRLVVSEQVTVTNLDTVGGTVTAYYHASPAAVFTTVNVNGGSVHSGRSFTTAKVSAGLLNVGREDSSLTLPTGGTLEITGGKVIWRGGNITTLVVRGTGVFDASMATQPFTISSLEVDATAKRNSKFQSPNATITLPGTPTVRCDVSDTVP